MRLYTQNHWLVSSKEDSKWSDIVKKDAIHIKTRYRINVQFNVYMYVCMFYSIVCFY